MCATTRFPEAILLRNITARPVVMALTRFFSTFGLPRTFQTDQGTNFKSTLFKQILVTPNVKHTMSNAYHPQSQGALERCIRPLSQCSRSTVWKPVKQCKNQLVLVLLNLSSATPQEVF